MDILGYIFVLLLGLGAGSLLLRFPPTRLIAPIKAFLDKQGDAAPHFIMAPVLIFLTVTIFLLDGRPVEMPVGAVREATTTRSAEQEEESARQNYGRYVQVLKGGVVADGKQFDTSKLPPNSWVNVYDSPRGHGWQIVTEYEDRIEYKGFGVDASDFTYTELKPVITASST